MPSIVMLIMAIVTGYLSHIALDATDAAMLAGTTGALIASAFWDFLVGQYAKLCREMLDDLKQSVP